jgi:DNA-binding GntR family transcriptional regulator
MKAALQTPLIRRESLTDQTAAAIREAILDGTYSLGQKLPEVELISRFGVSGSVIREALHILQGEGIIVTKPYCGRSVFSLRPDEDSELTTIRASLESYAAFLAAQKMTPADASAIRAAARRFLGDPPATYGEWVDLELTFHRAVWQASQNQWLIRQLNQFSVPIFVLRVLSREATMRKIWQNCRVCETPDNPFGHQILAEAVANGRAEEARSLMLTHIVTVRGDATADLIQSDEGARS